MPRPPLRSAGVLVVLVSATLLQAQLAQAQYSNVIAVTATGTNGANITVFGLESSFGPSLGATVLQAPVGIASPVNGCLPWAAAPVKPFIALIERGNCSFETKVWWAEHAGALYAVVFDNRPDGLIAMSSAGTLPNANISSVFVSQSDGIMLLDNAILQMNGTIIVMTYNNGDLLGTLLSQWVVIFVALVVFLTAAFVALLLFILAVLRRRSYRMRNGLKPVSPEVVVNLPLLEITDEHLQDPNMHITCAVCLEDFQAGTKVRSLPCGHLFHQECIDPWLTNHNRLCPTCKQDVETGQQAVHRPDLQEEGHASEVVELQVMGAGAASVATTTAADTDIKVVSASDGPHATSPSAAASSAAGEVRPVSTTVCMDDDNSSDDDHEAPLTVMQRVSSSSRLVLLHTPEVTEMIV